MPGLTISGVHLAPVTLDTPVEQNPATVASHATISVASGTALIGAAGSAWTITNYGIVEGSGDVGTGVSLSSSGTIFNRSSGTFAGANHGIALADGGTVFNAGTISAGTTGTNPGAVYLTGGGTVTNMSGGLISAASSGIVGLGANADTVANQGTITAASNGVYINTGGSVTNQSGGVIRVGGNGIELLVAPGSTYSGAVANLAGGTILAGGYGIYVQGGTATNQGTISAVSGGLLLKTGSTGTNETGGAILAASGVGVELDGGAFTNQSGATISAGVGIRLGEGGYVSNAMGGVVSGSVAGVVALGGAATLLNAGTIAGSGASGYAVTLAAGFADRLIIDPSAAFFGTVSGGNTIGANDVSTLELASGAGIGALTGLGSEYIDFAQVTIDAGATWASTGNVIGSGVTLTNLGNVAGQLTLAAGGVLTNASGGTITSSANAAVYGSGGPSTLVNAGLIADPAGYGASLGAGGTVTNASGGTITGAEMGVLIAGTTGTVVNDGSIAGGMFAAVELGDGGLVTNSGSGVIAGYGFAVGVGIFDAAGTVINAGSIAASFQSAVELENGGEVTNQATGTITGYTGAYGAADGVAIYNAAGTVTNFGSIASSGASAIYVFDGQVTNQSGGTVVGQNAGVIMGITGTVVNAGSISGNNPAYGGVVLKGGGQVINQGSGAITGYAGADGVSIQTAAGTVTNAGTIASTAATAIDLADGGSITNQSAGVISGGPFGVAFGGQPSTLINAGSITGASDAVLFAAGPANRLVIDPGAVFGGTVDGGNTVGGTAVSTVELASGASTGTLTGLGSTYIDFAQVTIDAGATWASSGNVIGSGVTLSNQGALSGQLTVAAGGVLSNAALIGSPTTLAAGAYLHNLSGATIVGSGAAAVRATGAATVVNGGLIDPATYGVYLPAGGTVSNVSGGTIVGTAAGVKVSGAAGMVTNAGSIHATGANSSGIALISGGTVANQFGGTIDGTLYGVASSNAATVTNSGRIGVGAVVGIGIAGGMVTNAGTATIAGTSDGIRIYTGGTVVDAGTISGGTDAVYFHSGFTNRLVADPGAVFNGALDGGNTVGAIAVSTLELASGATAGTLSGLGSKYVDFAQLTVDAGAIWTLTGTSPIAAHQTLTNSGTIAGPLTLAGGASLANATGGLITTSGSVAVYGLSSSSTIIVVNAGNIAGNATSASGRGVLLDAGGSVTNQSGAAISGYDGIYGGTTLTVVNAGTITAAAKGIFLSAGGSVTNQGTGTIAGNYVGVQAVGSLTMVNDGTVAGVNEGVFLEAGGSVTNQSAGTISAFDAAIRGGTDGTTLSVVNDGSITGNVGINLNLGGSVTNHSSAAISGNAGVRGIEALTVVNYGSITGVTGAVIGEGVQLFVGGSVTNHSSAAISGDVAIEGGIGGVLGSGGDLTVVNAGTISGTQYAIEFNAGFTNRLVIDPGAAFYGVVRSVSTGGPTAVSTLELASAAATGTLSGLGSKYLGFANVAIDAGAIWALTGDNFLPAGSTISNAGTLTLSDATLTAAGTVVNDGGIVLEPSTLTVGALTGAGTVTVGAGSTLDALGTIAGGETVMFAGGGGYLDLGSPDSVAGSVTNFAFGETIDLAGIAPGSVGYSSGELQLNGSNAFALGLANGNTLQIGTSADGTELTAIPPPAIGDLETSGPINLGTFYQGETASTALSIMNAATAGSAGLDVTATASGQATAAGSITELAPRATEGSDITAGIDTSSPGVQTGYVMLTYASDDGKGNIVNAGSAEIAVTGTVYGPATASLSSAPAYVHPGDSGGSVTVSITVSNTAPDNGYAENLDAQVVNFGTYVTAASGYVGDLKPQHSNDTALTATLSDTAIGSDSGEVQIALRSDGTGIDSHGTTTLGFGYVQATVDVDQYAVAALEEITGDGTLTPTGAAANYVLALGTVALNGTPLSAHLGVLNDVLGQADLLGGSFAISGDAEFDNSGFTAFGNGTATTGLAAQQVDSAPVVDLSTGTAGTFSETITLTPTGYNPSGYSGALTPEMLTVSGTVLCFLKGTQIATPSGEVPVERLAVGDMVVTAQGKAWPIVWIGAGRVLATRGRRSAATPVIVRKGALADNVPRRDLRVTKGHSLLLDGVLIPVEELINHRSILWDDQAQEVNLYHIELATHDVLIANGAPAESYRDDGNRWLFQNANSGWGLPPQPPCAPLLTGGSVVDAVWRRLLKRAGPRPGVLLTGDPDLHLLVDGGRLDAESRLGAYRFRLPRRPSSARIVSRAGTPAELGLARDPRPLGVALRQVALCRGAAVRVVAAEDPLLGEGFYAFEPDNGLRWTDGDAGVPAALFDGFDGPMELVLHVGCTTQYPLFAEADARAAM